MKLNRLETHDRFEHFTKQSFDINECCEDLLKQKPFGEHPFYIFCHPRTEDDGVNKRYIWQPRLTKPKAETNSLLAKADPNTDVLKILWIIPPPEMWPEYIKGNMFENKLICDSIAMFKKNKWIMEMPEPDDPSPDKVQDILFEYQPQLFRRDTLPPDKKAVWDMKMRAEKLP